eukprot:TRINITY_DN67909_c5_g3_i1.p1 TRINITY_DN67909_c5_g3~~TRINITY_DN67909_c5_g3_i1.p1  ORF type:complete len:276 (-),score=47.19 TRINITY_DN67909_c5_g3_i1:214-1002(-)
MLMNPSRMEETLDALDDGFKFPQEEEADMNPGEIIEDVFVMPREVSAIPKMHFKKGTTTLGFRIKSGVVFAADSRASMGQYVSSATVQKIIPITDRLVGTMAGGAADCQFWHRVLGKECRLWELRNKEQITVAAASKMLGNITYNYRHMGLSMGTMVGGVDKHGSALYYVDDDGSRIKGDKFSVGSGCIYAYSVLDQGYDENLSKEQAFELARRAIFHATHRDAGSGSIINVYYTDEKGWYRISSNDMMEFYEQWKPAHRLE